MMNQDGILELVLLGQSGDETAVEQLMFHAYTPVNYLCRKLLRNAQAAQEQTREVLQILARKLDTLQDPVLFEKWICRITAARCMQVLPQLRWETEVEEPVQEELPITGQALDEVQTADAVQKMVDSLPDDPRVCILLYCCGGLNSKSISQIAGYSVAAVHAYLNRGHTMLQEQLEHYQNEGTEFSGITSLAGILRAAMYRQQEDENALPMIYGILGREIPVPPDPGKKLVRLLSSILAVLILGILATGGFLLMKILGS